MHDDGKHEEAFEAFSDGLLVESRIKSASVLPVHAGALLYRYGSARPTTYYQARRLAAS